MTKEKKQDYEIIDNYLPQWQFNQIAQRFLSSGTQWMYMDSINYNPVEEDGKLFQFAHPLYQIQADGGNLSQTGPSSPYLQTLEPLLKKMQGHFLVRAKANLVTRTSENVKQGPFHHDLDTLPLELLKGGFKTSIFYINTTNGWTEFEDGTKIECVENRLLTFPAWKQHVGYSQTDEKVRILINFNYA